MDYLALELYYSGDYEEIPATTTPATATATATEDDRDYDAEYEESRQYQDYCNGF